MFPQVAEKLNQAALPIIDFQTCSKPAYWWDTLRPSMICAGYESPDELKSACQVRGQENKTLLDIFTHSGIISMRMVLSVADVLFKTFLMHYISGLASHVCVVFLCNSLCLWSFNLDRKKLPRLQAASDKRTRTLWGRDLFAIMGEHACRDMARSDV